MNQIPIVKVHLTRDSVCAGDDIDAPHERMVEVHAYRNILHLVEQFSTGYLASVKGVGHWWRAILNGKPIAIVRVTGIEPLVTDVELADKNKLHFEYYSATY